VKPVPGTVVIASSALWAAERRAGRTSGRETGGLLLGFRSEDTVCVADIIEVRDPSATRTRFSLPEKRREVALSHYLAKLPADSPIGYVGTWHSHPADVGPSRLDKQTFRRDAVCARDLVVLMVLTRQDSGWRQHFLLGRRRSGRPQIRTPHLIVN
jgi:integrative and conjugative element protein (TIGR02256 family)